MWVIETLVTSALESLTDPVYWAGYLCAGIFIRNIWWALIAGLLWPAAIEAGGWIIYPGEFLSWSQIGPFICGPIATAVVWFVRNYFRRNRTRSE